jgi:hypothetical protein
LNNLSIVVNQYFPLSFEGLLFNELHQTQRQHPDPILFNLTDHKFSFARFTLFCIGQEGKSPYKAPFGSLEFDENLNQNQLISFIRFIEVYCKEKNLKSLSIVSYPYCYAEQKSERFTKALLHQGFLITITDLNYHLNLLEGNFEDHIHNSERRRLKKCQHANFKFSVEENPDLEEMYQLIKETRESKGFPISMSLSDLKEIFKNYPDNYFAFIVRDGSKLIASSIGVRVNSKILYYYLPAHAANYNNYSPTVFLLKGMYDFCKRNSYEILDLGIATDKGLRNEGLIRFKEHLGAIVSNKLSFFKEII